MISLWTTARPRRARRSRFHRRAWVAAALVALTGCGDATGPLPREGAPQEFKFSIGGFDTGSTAVELQRNEVVVRRVSWNYAGGAVEEVRVVPTAAAWAEFWQAAADAGVRRWRREYRAEGVVDGAGWELRIVADGTVIHSQGSNAWPDRTGREHENVTDDFRAFMDALGTLTGQDF